MRPSIQEIARRSRKRLAPFAYPGEFDGYGNLVQRRYRRGLDCNCTVPCALFRCTSVHHKGRRDSPWCVGGTSMTEFVGPAHGGKSCARCWVAEEERRKRLGWKLLDAELAA